MTRKSNSSQIVSVDIDSTAASLRAVARAKMLKGDIGAISIDTCIFTGAGYRLEGGILKPLEQFKENGFQLIFSEVVISEIYRHMASQADEDKAALVSKLRGFGKSWLLPMDEQERVLKEIVGEKTGREIAQQRIKDFGSRTGFVLIRAKDNLDIDTLLKRYFNTKMPFESAGNKKAEFPDAISLLSLQGWAKKNGTSILFVTKDKGCQAFCSESDCLVAIEELDDALALIQERQKLLMEGLCKKIEHSFFQYASEDFWKKLTATIDNQIWDIDWVPQAESADYYESDMQSVDVLSVELMPSTSYSSLRAVELTQEEIVVQANAIIHIDATCHFSFSTKDAIDRDNGWNRRGLCFEEVTSPGRDITVV